MIKLLGADKVISALKRLLREAKVKYDTSVSVGFAQSYALPVHEMVLWKHRVGQPKYLQDALHAQKKTIRAEVTAMVKGGAKFSTALLVVGAMIQKEAQQLVPVATGALKNSAFTSLTDNETAVAETAHRKGEIRRSRYEAKHKS